MARSFETFESLAAQLYALPREEFIAARTERVTKAKADGNDDLARKLGALGKPSTAAWLANQLARQDPDQVRLLGKVGAALRDAHGKLAGEQLRKLSQQRQAVVRGLVEAARELSDKPVTMAIVRELESLFTTALARGSVARELAEGRLTGAKQFGDGSNWPLLADADAVPEPAPRKGRDELDQKRALSKARRELAEASAAATRAQEAASEATGNFERAQQDAAETKQRVQQLSDELAEAQQAADAAKQAVKPARKDRDTAERTAQRAQLKADQLAASVAELEKES
jgi:hypothetical protein